ncbi:hypothetical protein AVEN_111591-1 [Araneus ventricosus]|uniref:Uncharacterized protein n=1 Tax=Araneus ventricosus TaxID=182803 RepID=A0A4Y2VWI8_ARAVE|nr:hypothetical protein AVEN_111591-1 [Araneus ventricosus]
MKKLLLFNPLIKVFFKNRFYFVLVERNQRFYAESSTPSSLQKLEAGAKSACYHHTSPEEVVYLPGADLREDDTPFLSPRKTPALRLRANRIQSGGKKILLYKQRSSRQQERMAG